jgi:hypothetical protein
MVGPVSPCGGQLALAGGSLGLGQAGDVLVE